jgi:hypothetical protein
LSDGTSNQQAIGQPIKDGRRFSSIGTTLTWWQTNFAAGTPALLNMSMSLLFSRQRSSIPSIVATGLLLSEKFGPPPEPETTVALNGGLPDAGGTHHFHQRRVRQ